MLTFGFLINLFLYDVLTFEINNYMSRVLLLLLGYVFITFSNAWLLWLDFVPLPPEGFSTAMAKNYKTSFGKVRLGVDIFCLAFNILQHLYGKSLCKLGRGLLSLYLSLI